MNLKWLHYLPLLLALALVSLAIAGPFDDLPTPEEESPTPTPTPTPEPEASPTPTDPAMLQRYRPVPDPELAVQIHAGLTATKRPNIKKNIRIRVSNGVVQIDGTVHTFQEKALVEAVVRTLPGVREVKSKIKLDSGFRRQANPRDNRTLGQIAYDEQTRKMVVKRLASEPGVRISQLTVEVYVGVAVISGTVKTRELAEKINFIVGFVTDVRAVVVHLQIEDELS